VFLFLNITFAECQNAFRNSFPDSVVPNKSTIQRLVERFRETGSIGEKRRSGRLSVLSNDSLEDIRACLLQSPRKSLRKLSQQTGMTCGSVQTDTQRLKLHPYRVLLPHVLRDFWITLYNLNRITISYFIFNKVPMWPTATVQEINKMSPSATV
jgi:hypothetical protein